MVVPVWLIVATCEESSMKAARNALFAILLGMFAGYAAIAAIDHTMLGEVPADDFADER